MQNVTLAIVVGAICTLSACGGAQDPIETKTVSSGPAELPPAGEPIAEAPSAVDFSSTDLDGNNVALSDYRGKTVVVEWFNPECPFVKYAHGEGPLKEQPARVVEAGHVWLAVNSGASGKQGNGIELNKGAVTNWGMAYPVLVDESGAIGQQFGAKSTPHMFVVNGEGEIVYKGALDNAPMGKAEGEYTNYVDAALANLAAGQAVATPETQSYGCSVKY